MLWTRSTTRFLTATLALPVLSTTAASSTNSTFNLYSHLGNLSPYFIPSATPSFLLSGTPPNCTIDKGFLIHRHGSRNPLSDELLIIQNLSSYLNNNNNNNNNTPLFSSPQTTLPPEFAFLPTGWTSTFTTDALSAPGRLQLFSHGVDLALTHPSLYTTTVLAGDQDRVIESAEWFMAGYFGRDVNATTLHTIAEDGSTVSWITPAGTCANWSYSRGSDLVAEWGEVYLPPIAARINELLGVAYPGVNFTAAHIHGMLLACSYGTAVYGVGSSPWCGVFLPEEILHHEYEYDLLMRGAFGYGLPGDMGRVLGSLLVGNVTAFLQDNSADAENLSLNFGHDTTIDFGLTALGLAEDSDSEYPARGPVDAKRRWRTARQVPFAAQMFWKRLECEGGKRVQLVLNEANFDLAPTGCGSDGYGSCALEDFVGTEVVRDALNVRYGDERWTAACGTSS